MEIILQKIWEYYEEIMPKVNGKFDRSKINPMVKEILG